MDESERALLEQRIRNSARSGDMASAASVAIRGYGPELYGFLLGLHRDEQAAGEVFSEFTERLWKGLASFGWNSSFRTWAYTIARNASLTYRRNTLRRARRQTPLLADSELSAIADQVRSETAAYLKTESKSRIAQIRESLSLEDQELLTLRVDRELSWAELATVMHEGDGLDNASLKREAARLRKRFQHIKAQIKARGQREGLIDNGSEPQ